MLLSEAELSGRVAERCRDIGRSLAEVMRSAGVSRAFLSRKPKHGRRLDRLEALAAELDWSLADLLGLTVPARIDTGLLAKALRLAGQLAQRRPAEQREALIPELVGFLYEWLVNRAADGHPV